MDKSGRQNRVREALGRLYDHQPPYFREYLRRFKEDPTSRVFAPLAEAYRRLGRLDEAIAICMEGLSHHPEFHGGRVALAKCYLDKRMYADARVELERVVNVVPENLLAQRLLGDACLALHDAEAALHAYKMALLLAPTDVALAEKVHALERNAPGVFDRGVASEAPDEPVEHALESSDETGEDNTGTFVRDMTDVEDPSSVDEDLPPLWPDLTQAAAAPVTPPTADETAASAAPSASDGLEAILGEESSADDEAFKIEHVSSIFGEEGGKKKPEITTETLGDLYFSQGQYDRALRIFEKLRPTADVARKINACRSRLGVDTVTRVRQRKITVLKGILKRVRAEAASP